MSWKYIEFKRDTLILGALKQNRPACLTTVRTYLGDFLGHLDLFFLLLVLAPFLLGLVRLIVSDPRRGRQIRGPVTVPVHELGCRRVVIILKSISRA